MTPPEAHRSRIVHDLEASREVDAADIGVTVSAGIVTLTGEIGSAAERLAVRSIVLADRATVELVDELQVTLLPGEWRLSDGEITALVAARLSAYPELHGVVPGCDFHSVHLDGVVADPAHRRTAHHLARTTPGVHFVINRIETPSPDRAAAVRVAR